MENFYLFVFMSICLIILPGPDTAIVTKNTVSYGRSGGLMTMFGTCCALLIHTLAAVVGLSALIVKSAFLFSIFKYVGAVYLVYLGVKAFWSIKKPEETPTTEAKHETGSCFRNGFLTNLLNPKVAVFFLTFLPQFITSTSDTFLQFSITGLTYALLTILWFILYISLIHTISAFMKKPSTQRMIQGMTGFVLIGFGIKLALEKQH